MAAGAIGVCTATVWEAIAMRQAGIIDVLIANQVVGGEKIKALAQAARQGGLSPESWWTSGRFFRAARATTGSPCRKDIICGTTQLVP
jgi:hypothetical protein